MTDAPVPPAVVPPRSSGHDEHTLPIGTRLGEFEITHRIGEGGFSIVYLAWDHSLDRKIALKEYLPFSIAKRGFQTEVHPRSERHRETFDAGLRSFVNEAKLLAQFDHPSLVKVYRFWEANGTAYMAMPFYQGSTVRDTVRQMPSAPDEAWIGHLLRPLADALKVIHDAQCYHRDIAPDNVILLAESGEPLLLDFGAARRVVSNMTQALTVILKPGYAPVEQYDEIPSMKQGPWTDVYALAAMVHWLVIGKTPPPSVGRLLHDAYVPLTRAAAGRYSERFLAATDRALAVMPDQRTPSIKAFISDLGIDDVASPMATLSLPQVDPEATVIKLRTQAPTATAQTVALPRPAPVSTPAPPSIRPLANAATSAPQSPGAAVLPATTQITATRPPSAASRGLVMGGAAAVLAIAASGWWLTRSADPPLTTKVQAAPVDALRLGNAPPNEPEPKTGAAAPPARTVVPSARPPTGSLAAPSTEPSPGQTPATPPPQPAPPAAMSSATQPPVPAPTPRAAPRPARRDSATTNEAACASVLQQLSLGDSSPELIQRMKSLGCR